MAGRATPVSKESNYLDVLFQWSPWAEYGLSALLKTHFSLLPGTVRCSPALLVLQAGAAASDSSSTSRCAVF